MASGQMPGFRQRFLDTLMNPLMDRALAVVAVLPWAYALYGLAMRGQMTLPRASLAIQFFIVIVTMVSRTAPVRITPNPWYWLLTFVASYWGFFLSALIERGGAIVPDVVSNAISIVALAVAVYARLSLGRSMGLVPAQRVIVTRGAYRFVRHPIYAGIFIGYLGFMLRMYSPRNVALALIGSGLFVVKSFIEEGFLREDREYADYLTRVRRRWFPGLV